MVIIFAAIGTIAIGMYESVAGHLPVRHFTISLSGDAVHLPVWVEGWHEIWLIALFGIPISALTFGWLDAEKAVGRFGRKSLFFALLNYACTGVVWYYSEKIWLALPVIIAISGIHAVDAVRLKKPLFKTALFFAGTNLLVHGILFGMSAGFLWGWVFGMAQAMITLPSMLGIGNVYGCEDELIKKVEHAGELFRKIGAKKCVVVGPSNLASLDRVIEYARKKNYTFFHKEKEYILIRGEADATQHIMDC